MKKKYLLFTGEYYPSGVFHDYIGSFETIEDALSNIQNYHDWYHIVNLEWYNDYEKSIKN